MAEGDHDIVHSDVSIAFEKAKRMLFGMPTACEKCGVDDDGVDGYEYPKTHSRVMLCRKHAEELGFCFGCHDRFKDIQGHMATCRMVASAKDDDRHEAACGYVEVNAEALRAAHRFGNMLATAVIRAYQVYVKDDMYEAADLESLEAAIAAYTSDN